MCIAGMTMLKSAAELKRPLIGLATCPLTARRVLGASKILQPLQSWAGELQKHAKDGTHSCLHATAASISDASLRFLPLAEV